MHRLLRRQLRKYLGVTEEAPEELTAFLRAVDRTYTAYDEDRKLIERSLELSSGEMQALNRDLKLRRDELEANLERLKTMQQQLITQEKMAELGTLTAGIAHEIKNPLNFVKNFAELSRELIEELGGFIGPVREALDGSVRDEVDELFEMLGANVDKIREHSVRADNIVRGMLEHSRGGRGRFERTDLNRLLDEYMALAYHGVKAREPDFVATFEKDLDPELGEVDAVAADIARVFLNIVANACDATNSRREKEPPGGAYRPVISARTRRLAGDQVEIRIRDNGTGVSTEHLGRLFTPFFTTKPTGKGTGLGLSITYDIVVKLHNGTLRVESEPGEYTEFIISLPRARPATAT